MGKEDFSNDTACGGGSGFGKDTIASGGSAKSISGSSQCLGSKSGTFKPASSRSSVINVSFPKQFSYLHSILDRTLSIFYNLLSPRCSPISVIPCENWFTNFETALDHRVKAS